MATDPNILAVLVAAFIPMAVGAIWYGPLFGKRWMTLMETTEDEIRTTANPLKMYGVSFLGAIVMAFVLAHIILAFFAAGVAEAGWLAGLEGGFWCWLGFVLVTGWQAVAFENKKMALFVLNMAYNLVCLLAMGTLLGAWQ